MADKFSFTIPGAPVGKGRPRFTKQGYAYTPKETARYENLVKLAFTTKYPEHVPLEGPISISVGAWLVYPKSMSQKLRSSIIYYAHKPDADNILKIIADSLNGIAYRDDAQIVHAMIGKYYSDKPRVDVTVIPLLA